MQKPQIRESAKSSKEQHVVVRPTFKEVIHRMSNSRSGGFTGLKPVKLKLWSVEIGSASAAATALSAAPDINFNASTFPELTSWLAIYDECRVLKVKVHYKFYCGITPSSAPTQTDVACAIVFDPSVSAPASIGGVCEETFSSGPMIVHAGSNAGGTTLPTGVLTGLCEKFNVLTATPNKLAPISSSDCPGSSWFVMDGATPPTVFTHAFYGTALGAGGVINQRAYYELDVEMRIRT
jgi:hypothetical protein